MADRRIDGGASCPLGLNAGNQRFAVKKRVATITRFNRHARARAGAMTSGYVVEIEGALNAVLPKRMSRRLRVTAIAARQRRTSESDLFEAITI